MTTELEQKRLNNLIIRLLDMDVFRMINASRTHNFWKQNKNKIKTSIC